MANYKVAYGNRDDINSSIATGTIPPGSVILTADSSEIFFYSLDKRLKTYEERYKFTSRAEAEAWVEKYNCSGQILSVHEDNVCNVYVVGYDGRLHSITSNSYIKLDRDPAEYDYDYELLTHCINVVTNEVFILVNVVGYTAVWQKLLTNRSVQSDWNVTDENDPSYIRNKPTGVVDVNYVYTQSIASDNWVVKHNLGKFPSATIVDSSGNVVVGDINYIDMDTLTVRFKGSFSGKVFLN